MDSFCCPAFPALAEVHRALVVVQGEQDCLCPGQDVTGRS